MKYFAVFVACFLALIVSSWAGHTKNPQWEAWKKEHSKFYESQYVEKIKQRTFMANLKRIQAHNQKYDLGLKTFRVKLNKFADMTLEEFSKTYANTFERKNKAPMNGKDWKRSNDDPIPDSIDWRALGYVTDVKEMKFCAASHVFAEVAMLEALEARIRGSLIPLSEQNVIECAGKINVCTNGSVGDTYDYVLMNDGIDTADSYPNTDQIQQCQYDKSNIGIWVRSWAEMWGLNETVLQEVVADTPVTALIDSSSWEFMFYSDGVYTDDKCVTDQPSLAVAIVGYGNMTVNNQDTKHWILKNAWGTSWGIDGYMLFARERKNQCGISSDISLAC